jgi:hypothetical protein
MIKKNFRIYKAIDNAIQKKCDSFKVNKSDYIRMVLARYVFSDLLFDKWMKEQKLPVDLWQGQKSCPEFDGSTYELFHSTSDAEDAWRETKFIDDIIELKDTIPVTIKMEKDLYELFLSKKENLSAVVVLTVMFLMDLGIPELYHWYASVQHLSIEEL